MADEIRVLFTGAYQSPQLLELSGIGLRSVLEKCDIPVRVELPVGENLQVSISSPIQRLQPEHGPGGR